MKIWHSMSPEDELQLWLLPEASSSATTRTTFFTFSHSHFPWDVLQKSGNFLTLHLAPPSRQHLYQIKPHTKTSVQSWVSISKTNSVFYSRKAFLSVNDYGDTLCITMYNAPEHQNINGTIYRASVTSPTQPQSVHPAAIWQQTQKYLLLYHQTTEQLYSTNLLL